MSKKNAMLKDQEPKPIDLEQYLFPADVDLLQCVDERQTVEDTTNGVEIPGAIYGIIDAVKALKGISEQEARELIEKSGIPIGAHVDEHHGEKGCGYARLVETSPARVSAIEAVLAADRLNWVKQTKGPILHYVGEHHPTHATITRRGGFSIDSDQAWKDKGFGIFNCDVWIAGEFAKKLGIDPKQMMDHMEKVYRQTVTALSGITAFEEIQ